MYSSGMDVHVPGCCHADWTARRPKPFVLRVKRCYGRRSSLHSLSWLCIYSGTRSWLRLLCGLCSDFLSLAGYRCFDWLLAAADWITGNWLFHEFDFYVATLDVHRMAEDDRGYGPWSRVPVWDGSPLTWRRFRRDVTWWISSLELAKTTGYNLAARFLLRQTGVARQRGEKFLPDELAYVPPAKLEDPQMVICMMTPMQCRTTWSGSTN